VKSGVSDAEPAAFVDFLRVYAILCAKRSRLQAGITGIGIISGRDTRTAYTIPIRGTFPVCGGLAALLIRGRFNTRQGSKAIHLVGARATENRLVFAPVKTGSTFEADHGRQERRNHAVTDDVSWQGTAHPAWNTIKSIGLVESIHTLRETATSEQR
jgi:hypothetical protein